MIRRLLDWCVPASALCWVHLTMGDDFDFDSRGWVTRVPPGQGVRHPGARYVEEFMAGYVLEGGDVASLRAAWKAWPLWVGRGR